MARIYTKTGDKGMTSIHGGERIPKDDIRIEANGCIDELNAQIGIIRSLAENNEMWQQKLHMIQLSLMETMSHVATPSSIRELNPNPLPVGMDKFCEQWMDEMGKELTDNGYFLLPGGTLLAAQLQFARTVARRAERRLWSLNRQDELPDIILRFINRLSDLFFIMARYELQSQNWKEEKWRKFTYKRRLNYEE
ncbi:MAG TPA: cob(I)yrinic acid a,c-diamide adenosyltransferase [Parabacteroides sp.]|nr:cob(I)yrinic acid a,c-diamide adenosyltransferase [Parabacteroides sp.]